MFTRDELEVILTCIDVTLAAYEEHKPDSDAIPELEALYSIVALSLDNFEPEITFELEASDEEKAAEEYLEQWKDKRYEQ